jgi:hypothetical protein
MDISADGISQRYHRYGASPMQFMPEEGGTDPRELPIHLPKLSVEGMLIVRVTLHMQVKQAYEGAPALIF